MIENKIGERSSTLKESVTGEVNIEYNGGQEIKLTDFPLKPGTIEETLKYKVFVTSATTSQWRSLWKRQCVSMISRH
jgi:hypothetical protein